MRYHRFNFLSILLFLVPLPSQHAAEADPRSAVRAVVRLPSHGASATIIHTEEGRTLLLGCGHAFLGPDRNKPIRIDGPDAPQGAAQLIACDHQLDLSLVEVKSGPVKYAARVAGPGYRPGRKLLSVGYDEMNTPATERPATIVGGDERLTFTRERPWHGRSGGALLDQDTGVLIGVVQGYETAPPWYGLYASHAAIVQFLRQNGWAVSGRDRVEQGRGAERRVTPALPRFHEPCPT
jgi:hypothetical protein